MPQGANDEEVAITNHSMASSHSPRFSRNAPSAAGVLRVAIRPALVPARNTNTGAQKWVIQRVKKSASADVGVGRRVLCRAGVEEVAHVIQGHDHHDQAPHHVQRHQPVGARVERATDDVQMRQILAQPQLAHVSRRISH